MIICHHVPYFPNGPATLCRSCGHAMLMHSGLASPCGVCQILAAADQLSSELLPVVQAAIRAKHVVWEEPSARPDNAVDVTRFESLEPEYLPGREAVSDMTPSKGTTVYRVDDQEVSREEFERVASTGPIDLPTATE